MSFAKLSYDTCAYEKQLQESLDVGKYQIQTPIISNDDQFFTSPYIRLDKSQVATCKNMALIDVDSELLGLKNSEISDSIKSIKTNNFNDYVNKFRINYSIELINDNYLDNKTIESLAFESGFNSVQSFHRVFKKFKSKTPNEFLKNPIKN